MNIYLNQKLESIPIFKDLMTLLRGVLTSPELSKDILSQDDIYTTRHLYDPVRDFLDFYLGSSNTSMPESRQLYIVNALYASKGAPKVFETFEEVFGVNIEYRYEFPIIRLVEFQNIKISDIELFINKFINMLYYLLYYTEITLHIKNLIISLQGQLVQYSSGMIIGYEYYQLDSIEDGLTDNTKL